MAYAKRRSARRASTARRSTARRSTRRSTGRTVSRRATGTRKRASSARAGAARTMRIEIVSVPQAPAAVNPVMQMLADRMQKPTTPKKAKF